MSAGDPVHERGMEVRREGLGDEHVDAAVGAHDAVHGRLPGPQTRYAWGEIWTRRGWTARPAVDHTDRAHGAGVARRAGAARRGRLAQRSDRGRDQGGASAWGDLLRGAGRQRRFRRRSARPGRPR